jgi:signal transduction histidine kinase
MSVELGLKARKLVWILRSTAKDNVNIEGDKARVSQVVSNLLSNAIKFTKRQDNNLSRKD